MTKQNKMQDIKPDTERKYSLRELLKEKVNGERVLFIYNIAVICGVTSKQGVADICNGKSCNIYQRIAPDSRRRYQLRLTNYRKQYRYKRLMG